MTDFVGFHKIPRLDRDCIITEKIDGTNGQIFIGEDGEFLVGSRNRWLGPDKVNDNFGFCAWAMERKEQIIAELGPGRHFGEWWGRGIGRTYGLRDRRFSLFNTTRWGVELLVLCHVVPVIEITADGFESLAVWRTLQWLKESGSLAAPGFMEPEGIVIYHTASGHMYKKTLEDDEKGKSE